MKRGDMQKKDIPDSPGVYFFRGQDGKVLYIGKATNLRKRISSYFGVNIGGSRGGSIVKMVESAKTITYEQTDSVLEALISEAALIKKYQPVYNAKEKSDKSFNYIVITREDFPRVMLMRERDIFVNKISSPEISYYIGPFPYGSVSRSALKILRAIFPFRDTCTPYNNRPAKTVSKSCFNRQLGLCPGVCTGEINKRDYGKIITNLKMFLDGRKNVLLKKLEREMKYAAKRQKFEDAARLKNTLFALRHIQDISLIKNSTPEGKRRLTRRVEGYDVAHTSGTAMVGVMTVIEDGEPKKDAYRLFNIKTVKEINDTECLIEILRRRFAHSEWRYPHIVVVDGGVAQKNAAEGVLKELNIAIPVVSVVKDKRHKPVSVRGDSKYVKGNKNVILLANSEAHRFALSSHRKKRDRIRR